MAAIQKRFQCVSRLRPCARWPGRYRSFPVRQRAGGADRRRRDGARDRAGRAPWPIRGARPNLARLVRRSEPGLQRALGRSDRRHGRPETPMSPPAAGRIWSISGSAPGALGPVGANRCRIQEAGRNRAPATMVNYHPRAGQGQGRRFRRAPSCCCRIRPSAAIFLASSRAGPVAV